MAKIPSGIFLITTGDLNNESEARFVSIDVDMEVRTKENDNTKEEYRWIWRVVLEVDYFSIQVLSHETALRSQAILNASCNGSQDVEAYSDSTFYLISDKIAQLEAQGSKFVRRNQTWLSKPTSWTDAPWNP
jgi:hypothetical protein